MLWMLFICLFCVFNLYFIVWFILYLCSLCTVFAVHWWWLFDNEWGAVEDSHGRLSRDQQSINCTDHYTVQLTTSNCHAIVFVLWLLSVLCTFHSFQNAWSGVFSTEGIHHTVNFRMTNKNVLLRRKSLWSENCSHLKTCDRPMALDQEISRSHENDWNSGMSRNEEQLKIFLWLDFSHQNLT